jgi:two-component system, cell cycle sensor histidine kinase and response regulator CckA
MPRPLNILIVEDSPDDAELALRELRRAGFDPKWKRVETEPDFLAEIARSPDIILSDYSMPQFSGLRAAELLRQSGLDIPFILISGTVGEDIAVDAMKQGVTDYLLKDRVARLGIAVERALEEKRLRYERNRVEEARRISDARYRTLFDYAPDGIVIANEQGVYLDANPSLCRMLGYPHDKLVGLHSSEIVAQTEVSNIAPALTAINARQDYHREWQFRRKDGSVFDAEVIATAMPDGNLLGLIRDITERKQAEEALRSTHAQLRQLLEHSPAVIYSLKIDGTKLIPKVASDNITALLGYTVPEVLSYEWWYGNLHPEDRDRAVAGLSETMTQGASVTEYRMRHKDGTYRWVEDKRRLVSDAANQPEYLVGIWADISERKHAEEVLRNVSRQTSSRRNVRVLVDLAVIVGLGVLAEVFAFYTDVFEPPLVKLVSDFKDNLDDLFVPTGIVFVGLLVFSYRRWRDAQSKVTEQANIQETLRMLHGELEKRIQQRTAELAGANEALRAEIAGHKRVQEALQESQALYHSLVDEMPAGIFRKDRAGRYVFANPWFCQLRGLQTHQIVGRTPDELVAMEAAAHGQTPPEILQLLREGSTHHEEILRTGKPIHVEEIYPVPGEGKRYLHVLKTAVLGPGGQTIGTQGIQLDVTERRRAEESLKLLESAVKQSKESIMITDAELDLPGPKIIFVNPAFTQMTGYTAEEVIGKTPRILQGPRTDKTVLSHLRKNLERGELFAGEAINYRKDGKEFDLEWQITPLRDAAGKITHFVATQRDITGRKKLAEQLRQSQKMEAVGQLAGGVAHDFNNILAVIMMQADLMKSSGELPPAQKEFADEIGVAAERAAALTRQLLLFSRKETMRLQDLDLNESINNMTKMLRRTIGEDLQMQFKFAMQSLHVRADPNMMDQVLMNLAVNARDAMPKGGKLVIETSAEVFDETAAAQSPNVRPGSFVCLGVSDTGCGIPPENLQRIFEPFFTTKEVGRGTGLGLATVFGIIQQHQGWINVYSEVGRGTTIRIYLPLLATPPGQEPVPLSFSSMPRGNETILLVEDDAAVRKSVHRTLVQLGYQVLEAVNGVDALDVWKQNRDKIHLVLTDMVMPGGMTGKDLGEFLRKENPGLKMVYASGYSAEMAEKGLTLEEGVDFLTKPFSAASLARILRARLDS